MPGRLTPTASRSVRPLDGVKLPDCAGNRKQNQLLEMRQVWLAGGTWRVAWTAPKTPSICPYTRPSTRDSFASEVWSTCVDLRRADGPVRIGHVDRATRCPPCCYEAERGRDALEPHPQPRPRPPTAIKGWGAKAAWKRTRSPDSREGESSLARWGPTTTDQTGSHDRMGCQVPDLGGVSRADYAEFRPLSLAARRQACRSVCSSLLCA